MGEQREKMGQYAHATKCYNEGKLQAETHFGPKHELYTRCVNGIGSVRLKSKYQTREVYRNTTSEIPPNPPKRPASSNRVKQVKLAKKKLELKRDITKKIINDRALKANTNK